MTDEEIKKIIREYYSGNPESILAKKMFDVAREVSNLTEMRIGDLYREENLRYYDTIHALEREIAILKGEEPPPLIAYAQS